MCGVDSLIVAQRFCGPPSSGNGGWTAGALAACIEGCPDDRSDAWPTVTVSLRMPPPLDVALPVTTGSGTATATHDGAPVAIAQAEDQTLAEVEGVDAATAKAAEAAYPGLRSHPFPTCFVCGTEREEGDGLRIFPGFVRDQAVAATWTPHPSLAEDFHTYGDDLRRASLAATWAALDCNGAWAAGMAETSMVLARMTARIDTLPVIGEEHVVVGEVRSQEGRKNHTATTLYDADTRVVGTSEQLWITVDASTFR